MVISIGVSVFLSSPLAVKRDNCYYIANVYVPASVQIGWGQYSYIYGWISKFFDTVVVLEEEECHLKHFFR